MKPNTLHEISNYKLKTLIKNYAKAKLEMDAIFNSWDGDPAILKRDYKYIGLKRYCEAAKEWMIAIGINPQDKYIRDIYTEIITKEKENDNMKNKNIKSCSNCKNRCWSSYYGYDYCIDYEMATTEEEYIESAKDCKKYEEGKPDCFDEEGGSGYKPSSTARDYSPSNPWDAPGMSIKDFI